MKKEEIKSGMVFRNVVTGQIGVLFEGFDYGCIDSSIEVPIVYQGTDKNPSTPAFFGTKFEDIESYSLKPEDMLTMDHIRAVCKPRTERTCRYLMVGENGFECARVLGDTSIAWKLDDRANEGSIRAIGNNCGGRYGTTK
jgi:hypothetical protein